MLFSKFGKFAFTGRSGGRSVEQLTRECFNRKGNNLEDGFCPRSVPRRTICSHGSQRTWDLYLDRDSLSRVQACVQRRRLASSFQRAKSTTSRTGGTSRRCRNRFCTLNERGVEEDERMKEEKTERRRQSLSKRAKNLLLRGRGYFSRRTTFLTKLNVFFTLPREKKVRRYLKRGCSPEIPLSLSVSTCGEKWKRLRNEKREKGR